MSEAETKPEVIAGFEVHPIASCYPMIQRHESGGDLAASISQNGVLIPVVLDQHNRIVDGRNRAAAWESLVKRKGQFDPALGEKWAAENPLPTQVKHFDQLGDVWDFIRDMNDTRRHLSPDQAAAVYLRVREVISAEVEKAKAASQFKPGNKANPEGLGGKSGKELTVDTNSYPPSTEEPKRDTKKKNADSTVGKLAEAAGVSHHKAAQAVKVAKAAPELVDKVAKGELPLKEAAKEADKRAGKAPKPKSPLQKVLAMLSKLDPADLDAVRGWLMEGSR